MKKFLFSLFCLFSLYGDPIKNLEQQFSLEKFDFLIVKEGEKEKVQSYFFPLIKIKQFSLEKTILDETKEPLLISMQEVSSSLKEILLGMKEKEIKRIYFSSGVYFEIEIIETNHYFPLKSLTFPNPLHENHSLST